MEVNVREILKAEREYQARAERAERQLRKIAEASPVSDDLATVSKCFYRIRGEARAALAASGPDTPEATE